MKRGLRFLASVAAGGLLAHLVWSWAAGQMMLAEHPGRLWDVRRAGVTADDFVPLAAHYIRAKAKPGRPLVVLTGSSAMYGYPFSETVALPSVVAAGLPNATVLNISAVGAGGIGTADALACALDLSGVRPDAIVVELQVINDAYHANTAREDGRGGPTRRTIKCPTELQPLAATFLTKPWGLGLVKALWNNETDDVQQPMQENALVPGYILPADQYAAVAADLADLRVEVIDMLKRRSPIVVAFPGPMHYAALARAGFNEANTRSQYGDAIAACQRSRADACLDFSPLARDDVHFRDVAHFSVEGNRKAGGRVLEELRQRLRL